MTTSKTEAPYYPKFDEQVVAEYLEANPEFFDRHGKLLNKLKLAHESGGSVSLIERQIKTLREQNEAQHKQIVEMLTAATANEQLLSSCTMLCLKMIEHNTLEERIAELHRCMLDQFGMDSSVIWLYDEKHTDIPGVQYCKRTDLYKLTNCHFPDNEPVCGRLTSQIAKLFETSDKLESVALVPVGKQAEIGLLILGSKDIERFTADMGTVFLRLIGDILGTTLDQV